jgi:hypothetical protein
VPSETLVACGICTLVCMSENILACCASLDLHKESVEASVRRIEPNGRVHSETRHRGTITRDFLEMADRPAAASSQELIVSLCLSLRENSARSGLCSIVPRARLLYCSSFVRKQGLIAGITSFNSKHLETIKSHNHENYIPLAYL